MNEEFQVGQAVRFINGKFKGFTGNIMKLSESVCSVRIEYEHRFYEVVEETKFLTDMKKFNDAMNETEKTLRGT